MKEKLIVRLWRRLVALGPTSEIAESGLRYSLAASLRGVEYDPPAIATARRVMRALVRATRIVAAQMRDEGRVRGDIGGGWTLSLTESEARVECLITPPRSAGAEPVAAVYLDRYTYLHPPYQHWSWRFGWVRGLREARAAAVARRDARHEAHVLYLLRLAEAAEAVARGGYYEACDGQRGGTVRLPSWPEGVRVSAVSVAQRTGIDPVAAATP